MSSPYSTSAFPAAGTGVPFGFNALTNAEYATFLSMAAAHPAKVYEPLMASGALVLTVAGDCITAWGGSYAS